jgi:hypothetical protein
METVEISISVATEPALWTKLRVDPLKVWQGTFRVTSAH